MQIDLKDSTVLVIEDNVSNLMLVDRLLGHAGIHCEKRTSSRGITEFAQSLPRLDLVLLDIRLPDEDGFQVLRTLRTSEKLRQVPVVAVTAYASPDQMQRARSAGFDGFIGKPLDVDRFPDQVRRAMAGIPVWELE